ncbi:hypothetical protein FRB93_001994 [Tulasnella sp. JGI-2019a]|nr:hypothetical protein FRB93_001994 [Tulasnella sp. JGI-2019a]
MNSVLRRSHEPSWCCFFTAFIFDRATTIRTLFENMVATLVKPATRLTTAAPIFVGLSIFGCYAIHAHLIISEGQLALEQNPIKWSNTGNEPLDAFFDIILTFFTYTVTPGTSVRAFGYSFWTSISVFVAIMELEAVRTGASSWMQRTAFWAILYEGVGGGVIIPLYALAFLSQYPTPSSRGSAIPATAADGVVFGLLFGYAPSVIAMYAISSPRALAVFQFFPLYVSALRYIYTSVLGRSHRQQPLTKTETIKGYTVTLRTLAVVGIVSAYFHIQYILLPIISHSTPLTHFKHLYVPSITSPSPATTTAITAVHHILQWDNILILGSMFLAGIWDFDLATKFKVILWSFGVGVALGPGAALAGVWAYRQSVIRDMQRKVKE